MTSTQAPSLRAVLLGGVESVPELGILLPRGWAATAAAPTARDEVERALAPFPAEQRATLRTAFGPMLERMRDREADHVLLGTIGQEPDVEAPVPMTMTLACVTAPTGTDVRGLVQQAREQHDARPLDPDGTILRWMEQQTVPLEGGDARFVTIVHLLRVPRDPRRALLVRTMILRSADGTEVPEEGIMAMAGLSDGIVASVRWRRHA